MMKKQVMWIGLIGIVLLLSPAAARADWLFTPQIGTTITNGANLSYGASIGWVGDGKFGFEFEWAVAQSFLDTDFDDGIVRDFDHDLLDNRASSYMFNAVVGGPKDGASNTFRPYFSGGVGWLRSSIESEELLFEEDNTKFGFNLGGGVMTYVRNIGLRGDVRYYQTMSDSEFNDTLGLEIGDYDFWRATVGVTFRW